MRLEILIDRIEKMSNRLISLPAVQIQDGKLMIPDFARIKYEELMRFCIKNRNGYVSITLDIPHKPRTTGDQSQSHAINGYISQITKVTGDDFDYVKMYCKRKAVSKGYPTTVTQLGETIPKSESLIDTIEAGYLIDTIKEVGAFVGITKFRGEK